MAMGTLLTSFSVTLNNHTIAAALLFASIYSAWQGKNFIAGLWGLLRGAAGVTDRLSDKLSNSKVRKK